jgi:prepilin-type N-terminal cleavage/methylation domain-containing protein
MKNYNPDSKGFTLVELAIVLMIIGLLIGGILKGQELITNARITSSAAQFQGYDAAVITFQDSYGALPGDLTSPSTRLPNCTAAGCNTAGNGNGKIGIDNGWGAGNPEATAFWLHLAAANLISGVNASASWDASNMFTIPPEFKLGGQTSVLFINNTTSIFTSLPTGGHYWHNFGAISGGSSTTQAMNYQYIRRLDQKIDDGKPLTGNFLLYPGAPLASDNINYDANHIAPYYFLMKTSF